MNHIVFLLRLIALTTAYALVARWVLIFSTVFGNATIMWLPGGIGLAALLVFGLRYWPFIFVGSTVAGLWMGDPLWASLAIASGNTLASLSISSLLAGAWHDFDPKMNRARDFLLLIIATAAGSMISAIIGPLTLLSLNFIAAKDLAGHILHWWQADVLGVIVATPLLLTWRQFPSDWFANKPRKFETLLFLAFSVTLIEINFMGWFHDWFDLYTHSHWMYVLIVWAALRFDRQGTTLILAVIAVSALQGAALNKGIFEQDIILTGLQNFWFFQTVITFVGVLIVLTLNARNLAEQKLQLAALVYENSSEAMMVTDADNRIVSVNPAFTSCTGYSAAEVIGKNPKILSSGRQDQAFYQAMWHALETTGRWEGEIYNRRKNTEIYVEWVIIDTVFNDNHVQKRVALFYDITEQKKTEELIWLQANYDPLTELPNRRLFTDRLQQELLKAQREASVLAVLFIDLDHFKNVNDSLGHDIGDALLIEAAKRLSRCVRKSDTVARLGGDEFIIILTDLKDLCDDSSSIAQNIITSLEQPFHLDDNSLYISASIGIAVYPTDASNCEDLLRYADQAMYTSKSKGRNDYCYFAPEMQKTAENHSQIAMDLRRALADQQFELHYQPIIDLETHEIIKAEALIRWRHPNRGLIMPGEFIAIAEETGDICSLGEWIFQESTQQLQRWRERYQPDFQLSINKSPAQFRRQSGEHSHWSQQLQAMNLPGNSLVVEITEGLLMNANQHIFEQLLHFRDSGIQVAIDDFGTGYSSLAYLEKFDIDYLKIDQMFTRNLEPHSKDSALVEAIVVMAHKLGLKVIAEGIETEQQRDLLKAIGCDYGQGYLFSKPLPTDQFEALLAEPTELARQDH
jgi:diguanylate cyclase (GGDEF)-like protein/PAS domain S-box-containing protein